ncbi:MAG: multicopper oxidase domain-containing protein, partial [Nanoarchaeota archaeon]
MEKTKLIIPLNMLLMLAFVSLFFITACSINTQSQDRGMDVTSAKTSIIERSIAGLSNAKTNSIIELSENEAYNLEARPVAKEINGNKVRMLAYNGQIPGPILKVKQNSAAYINFTNNLGTQTTIHWHGIRVENEYDGVPDVTQQPISPGQSFIYKLNFPDEGVYWYHPHLREDMQQELGLYGAVLVKPSDKNYYNKADKEIVLFLDDISMQGNDVTTFYDNRITHTLMGRFGNVMLVNGAEAYNLEMQKGDIIRFYIINVANSRTFNFMIGEHKLKIIGSDSGRYEGEFFADSQIIGVSERYIAEVLFEKEGSFNVVHKTPEKEYIFGTVKVMPSSKEIPKEFYDVKKNQNPSLKSEDYKKYLSINPDYSFELTVDMSMMDMELHRAMMDNMMMSGKEPIEWEDDMPEMNALSTNENIKWVI